jgi:hypothetical protein
VCFTASIGFAPGQGLLHFVSGGLRLRSGHAGLDADRRDDAACSDEHGHDLQRHDLRQFRRSLVQVAVATGLQQNEPVPPADANVAKVFGSAWDADDAWVLLGAQLAQPIIPTSRFARSSEEM